MSRIGNKTITLPAGVTVTEEAGKAKVVGPKGTLFVPINHGISMHVEGNEVKFTRANEEKQTKQNHGTTRANVHNAVVGVSQGYVKSLEMRGIGYKAQLKGNDIELWAGYSHTVIVKADEGVKISLKSPTEINVEGIDRELVGQTAARIRAVRVPEVYLGKGIRYVGERVLLKEGKKAGK